MNHRRLFAITAGLLISLLATAAPVGRDDALKKAEAFVSNRHGGNAARGLSQAAQQRRLTAANNAQQAYWYAFNVGQGEGFVIVSGDDRTDAILGYADKGAIDPATMPDNLKAWLQGYADQMKYMDDHNIQASQPATARGMKRAAVKESIAPRMITLWDQSAPYNLQCPFDGTERSVTGCVATALAQVLYWHATNNNVDTQSTAIESYTTDSEKIPLEELPATAFEWNLMQPTYRKLSSDETEKGLEMWEQEQRQAVAKLLRYCGQSVKMDYTSNSSSATTSDCAKAMVKYFGYDDTTRHFSRSNYSYTEWVQLIYDELAQRGPLIYHGQSAGGGHSFVCDGYDGDDYFYFNWGWSGDSNGYFKLSVLNPKTQGIGGSSTTDGYNYLQGAVLNVNPVNDGNPFYRPLLTVTDTECKDQTIPVTESFEVKTALFNLTGETQTFDYALALYQESTFVKLLTDSRHNEFENNMGYKLVSSPTNFTFTLPSDLADGIYTICAVSKIQGTEEWNKCEYSNQHFVTALVSEGQVTLTSSEPSLTATLDAPDIMVKNHPYTVKVTLTNTGNVYDNEIVVCFMYNNSIYETIGSKQVQVARGKSVELTFDYTPSKWWGTLPLVVRNGARTVLTLQDVTVTNDGAGSADLDLNVEYTVANLNGIGQTSLEQEGAAIIGNKLDITATYTNSNETNFGGSIRYIVFEFEPEATEGFGKFIKKNIYIPAGEAYTLHVVHEMKPGWSYKARFDYIKENTWTQGAIMPIDIGMASNAIYAYNADGTLTVTESTGSDYEVPNDVTSVKLAGTGITSVTPNDNPNTLYIIGSDEAVPTGLSDKNIVKGDVAGEIALADGSDFAAPIDFTATTISYTRSNFPAADDSDGGWTTIVLPFDVSRVTANGEEIDWFHSHNDTGKRFWVRQFESDGNGSIFFAEATSMKANTPYIIALPGSSWGKKWDLSSKEIVFHGDNATITANARLVRSGSDYRFVGTTVATAPEGAYVLNDAGNSFEQQEEETSIAPFRAYFTAQRWLDGTQSELRMQTIYYLDDPTIDNGGVATAIAALPAPTVPATNPAASAEATVTVCSLSGQPLRTLTPTSSGNPLQGLPKGLYIVNGKKLVNP